MDWSELEPGAVRYPSHANLGSLADAIAEGRATSFQKEFTRVAGAGSDTRRIACAPDERLVLTEATVWCETAALTNDCRIVFFQGQTQPTPGASGSAGAAGRRSAEEEPTKETLTLGNGTATGGFISFHHDKGLPLAEGASLGITVPGPTGGDLRILVLGWRVAPRSRVTR